MDNKKFETLIELIINENEEQARALFHDIVVEKSREIYENIIAEEMDMEGSGQVMDMMDEIAAEESGVVEGDEEEFDISDDDGEEEVEFAADEFGDDEGEEDLEDRVVDLEDKLDQLMAEFEELMADEEGEEHVGDEEGEEEDFGDEGEEDFGDEEAEDDEDTLEESITLKKVSVTHGDNGQNTKSVALNAPKVKAAGVNPVRFAGDSEAVPTSPKGPSNAYSKGETEVKHAKQWKNAPAQAGQDLEKAPAPKKGDDGSNTKSPLGESKKRAKKRV